MTTALYTDRTPASFDSTLLKQAYYNNIGRALYVEFHTGEQYAYYDVGVRYWENLLYSGSPGAYYNSEIKGRFRGTKGNFEFVDYYNQPGVLPPAPTTKAPDDERVYTIKFTLEGVGTVKAVDLKAAVNKFGETLENSPFSVEYLRILSAGESE
jgi:hypothetical protein